MKNLLGSAFGHKEEEKPKKEFQEHVSKGKKRPYNVPRRVDEIIREIPSFSGEDSFDPSPFYSTRTDSGKYLPKRKMKINRIKRKIKNGLKTTATTGLAGLIFLNSFGCASAQKSQGQRIEGKVGFAYVPKRTDDIPQKNEWGGEVGLDYILPIKESTFSCGINLKAYGKSGNPLWDGVRTNKFIGEAHLVYRIGDVEFYLIHLSAHPFKKKAIENNEGTPYYFVNGSPHPTIPEYDLLTKIGATFYFTAPIGGN